MIPIKPFTQKCAYCNWKKRFSPKNDHLIISVDIVSECPKCGSKDLKTFEEKSTIKSFLRKIL